MTTTARVRSYFLRRKYFSVGDLAVFLQCSPFRFVRQRSVYAIRLCAFFMFEKFGDERRKIFRSIIIALPSCVWVSGFRVATRWKCVHCVGEKSPFAFFFGPSENLIFTFPLIVSKISRDIKLNWESQWPRRAIETFSGTKTLRILRKNQPAWWRPGKGNSSHFSPTFTSTSRLNYIISRKNAHYSPCFQHSLHLISQINTCFSVQNYIFQNGVFFSTEHCILWTDLFAGSPLNENETLAKHQIAPVRGVRVSIKMFLKMKQTVAT